MGFGGFLGEFTPQNRRWGMYPCVWTLHSIHCEAQKKHQIFFIVSNS